MTVEKQEMIVWFVSLFERKPHLLPPYKEPDEAGTLAWEEIFHEYFGSHPVDPEEKPPDWTPEWRPGSTDPRWDKLLLTFDGYNAFRDAAAILKEESAGDKAA